MHLVIRVTALAASLFGGAACDSGAQARPFASPTSVPVVSPPRAELAGAYALTIEADSACVGLPPAVRKRTYQASLEVTPQPYLAIAIAGGGFVEATTVGQLWSANSLVNWIANRPDDWNDVEVAGCDGHWELLDASGSSMMICGTGVAQEGDNTLTVDLSGQIVVDWVEPDPLGDGTWRRIITCEGIHQLTFGRISR